MKNKKTFKEENNELLKNILDMYFFSEWDNNTKDDFFKNSLEIIVTSDCNLKCEYCYLYRYGDSLYPKNIRNRQTILNNLKILLDYLIEKKYRIDRLDIFSGEIWESDFGIEILEILFKYLKDNKIFNKILIPSNGSFINNSYFSSKIKNLIKRFKDIGVLLMFSISIDGKILENYTRSFKKEENNELRTDEYYDNIFKFVQMNNFGFHPMVSAYGIEKWIDNYDWWVQMLKKYNMSIDRLMMLEVRNDNWTKESIDMYLKFLNHVIDYKFKYIYNENKVEFAKKQFGISNNIGYNNTALLQVGNRFTCNIQRAPHIRLGDLSIVPCHRTAYDKFKFGNFIVEDNKIKDIEAYNPELAIRILLGNQKALQFNCYKCAYQDFCIGGCIGSQYESTGELFLPIYSVCNLIKAKIDFLIDKYEKMGLFNIEEVKNKTNKIIEFVKNKEI